MPLGGLERPLQVVEHGQELADEPLVRVRDEPLLLAGGALAVVLEVRLHALQEVEVLVSLRRDRADERSSGAAARLGTCVARLLRRVPSSR